MRLLIATHGTMAEGLKSAVSIIIGNVSKIDTLTGYVNDIDIKDEIDKYFENINEELIVCTDLFGGSVNQVILQKFKEKDFLLISGVNLPLLLELTLLINNNDINIEKIRNLITNTQKQIMLVNDILGNQSEDDFD